MSDQKQKGRKDSWKKLGMDLAKVECLGHVDQLKKHCKVLGIFLEDNVRGLTPCLTCRARALRRSAKKRSPK